MTRFSVNPGGMRQFEQQAQAAMNEAVTAAQARDDVEFTEALRQEFMRRGLQLDDHTARRIAEQVSEGTGDEQA